MTDHPLNGRSVAILVANGFEEIEMTEPQRALLSAGATVKLVSPEQGLVNGWHGKAWGHYFPIDQALSSALAADFDALLVPSGFRSIDKLIDLAHTKRFLRGFADGNKPIVVCGVAGRILAAVERAAGRTLATTEAHAEALQSAGAIASTDSIVNDRNILSVGEEYDMDEFKSAVVKLITESFESVPDAA